MPPEIGMIKSSYICINDMLCPCAPLFASQSRVQHAGRVRMRISQHPDAERIKFLYNIVQEGPSLFRDLLRLRLRLRLDSPFTYRV